MQKLSLSNTKNFIATSNSSFKIVKNSFKIYKICSSSFKIYNSTFKIYKICCPEPKNLFYLK